MLPSLNHWFPMCLTLTSRVGVNYLVLPGDDDAPAEAIVCFLQQIRGSPANTAGPARGAPGVDRHQGFGVFECQPLFCDFCLFSRV